MVSASTTAFSVTSVEAGTNSAVEAVAVCCPPETIATKSAAAQPLTSAGRSTRVGRACTALGPGHRGRRCRSAGAWPRRGCCESPSARGQRGGPLLFSILNLVAEGVLDALTQGCGDSGAVGRAASRRWRASCPARGLRGPYPAEGQPESINQVSSIRRRSVARRTDLREGQGFVVEASRCIDLRAIEQAGDLFGGTATAVAGEPRQRRDRQVGHGILGRRGEHVREDTRATREPRGVWYYYWHSKSTQECKVWRARIYSGRCCPAWRRRPPSAERTQRSSASSCTWRWKMT